MHGDPAPIAVLERIRELECELAEKWKCLAAGSPASVDGSFDALEVYVAGVGYLVPVGVIREVVAMVWPTPLAGAPPWVMGTTRYGIREVPLIDLGLRLAGIATEVEQQLMIVVIDSPTWLGLVVEGVGDVVKVNAATLSSAGPELPHAPFLLGVARGEDDESAHVLSVRKLGHELDR